MTIFDRSWYGRVLVERVERFCSEEDWMRAYHEINDFEEQLVEAGGIVIKFWLTITKDEQLRRFRERAEDAVQALQDHAPRTGATARSGTRTKSAVCDMVERTSNARSRRGYWSPANDKYFARIQVLKTLCERIEAAL